FPRTADGSRSVPGIFRRLLLFGGRRFGRRRGGRLAFLRHAFAFFSGRSRQRHRLVFRRGLDLFHDRQRLAGRRLVLVVRAEPPRLIADINERQKVPTQIEDRHVPPPAIVLDLIVVVGMLFDEGRVHTQLFVNRVGRDGSSLLHPQ